eukprot:355623-Chlamydomonas_euryale.AAC.15
MASLRPRVQVRFPGAPGKHFSREKVAAIRVASPEALDHTILVELKTCRDTDPQRQLEAAQRQHEELRRQLAAVGGGQPTQVYRCQPIDSCRS